MGASTRWLGLGVCALLVAGGGVATIRNAELAVSGRRSGPASAAAAHVGAGAPTRSVHAAAAAETVALHSFDDCGELDRYVHATTSEVVGAFGLEGQHGWGTVGAVAVGGSAAGSAATAGGAAPQAASADSGAGFSTTNVQERGVDEPDIVKNDDGRAFTLFGGVLRAIDLDDGGGEVTGELVLDVPATAELLLLDDRIVVLSSADSSATHLDVVDADRLTLVRRVDVEGSYVSARSVGGRIRVVVTQNGPAFPFTYPQSDTPQATTDAIAHNRALVERARLAEWLPDVTVDGTRRLGPVGGCGGVYAPSTFSGPGSTTVVTFDAADARILDATSVLATASEVYATAEHLYVATQAWDDVSTNVMTELHRFDISDPGRAVYEASGAVAGRLLRPPWFVGTSNLGQWAMSEHEGDLRVATTLEPMTTGSSSSVTVLRETAGRLVAIGSVIGLGLNEEIYAVRFFGPTAYVVTYRKVDPLFVIDLHDPTQPAVTGELKVRGYSAYLHPVGDGWLLGIGQDDDNEDGLADGSQVSLFDVRDMAAPARADQLSLGTRGAVAGVEADHRAFTWWPAAHRAMITVTDFEDPTRFQGAVVVEVNGDDLVEVGRVEHRAGDAPCATPIERTRVVGSALVTFSALGVGIDRLDDLSTRDFVDYRTGAVDPRCPRTGPPPTTTTTTSSTLLPPIGE